MSDLAQIEVNIRHYQKLLDDALSYGVRAATEHSDADDAYRVRHAQVFLEAKDDGATDAQAKAKADVATEGVRKRARLAESMDKLALEAIRSRRTQISAEQSLLGSHREEASYGRTGPREAA